MIGQIVGPVLSLLRGVIQPIQGKLNVRRQRKELAPTIEQLRLADQIILWKIVKTHGMNEPQIKAFAEKNGLNMPHMGILSDNTLLLTHDFAGQWRVKEEVGSAVAAEIEKRLRLVVRRLLFQGTIIPDLQKQTNAPTAPSTDQTPEEHFEQHQVSSQGQHGASAMRGHLQTMVSRGPCVPPREIRVTTTGQGNQSVDVGVRAKQITFQPCGVLVKLEELPKQVKLANQNVTVVWFDDHNIVLDDHGAVIALNIFVES